MTGHFLESLEYDALAFGNHEFDGGVESLVRAISTFPAKTRLLSANMEADVSTGLKKDNYMVKEFEYSGVRTKVGVIGYITPSTAVLSNPGPNVTFEAVVGAVKREVAELKKQGVTVIVALGHAGLETDIAICDEVEGVDIVVGGHSNTFLANPDSADTFPEGAEVKEKIEGPYPLERRGGKCIVVQAFAYGKFIGSLQTEFDLSGDLTDYSGDPIIMWEVEQDSGMLTYLEPFTAAAKEYGKKVVGSTSRDLDGNPVSCRFGECEMGNLIADAFVDSYNKHDKTVVCGIYNSGGIRAGLKQGDITYEEVVTVLPYGNTADKFSVSGAILKKAFELSVSTFNSTGFNIGGKASFLQISGLKVHYNLTKEPGNRVRLLLIVNTNDGQYLEVQDEASYNCVGSSFMLNGGDGFDMLMGLTKVDGVKDAAVFSYFIEKNNPLDENNALENMPSRIFFDHEANGGSAGSYTFLGILLLTLSLIV